MCEGLLHATSVKQKWHAVVTEMPKLRYSRLRRQWVLHSETTYLFQVLVSQLDGEQQLPGSIEVAQYPAGQDVGFI